jgi:hypothetical protein
MYVIKEKTHFMFDIFLNISNKVNKILLSSYRNVIEPCYIMHLDIMRYL